METNFPGRAGATTAWVPSPTAKQKMGERAFRVTPVGAGPFTVVSNKLSSQIVLKKNPTYFKKDRPFLSQLTFKSIGGDEATFALNVGFHFEPFDHSRY